MHRPVRTERHDEAEWYTRSCFVVKVKRVDRQARADGQAEAYTSRKSPPWQEEYAHAVRGGPSAGALRDVQLGGAVLSESG